LGSLRTYLGKPKDLLLGQIKLAITTVTSRATCAFVALNSWGCKTGYKTAEPLAATVGTNQLSTVITHLAQLLHLLTTVSTRKFIDRHGNSPLV